jgi:hypothetical protein
MERHTTQRILLRSEADILVSRDRIRIIPPIIISVVTLLGSIWGLWSFLGASFTPGNLYLDPSYLVILLVDLFICWYLLEIITHHILRNDSVLVINHEGVRIQRLPKPTIDNLFISWSEIERIGSRRSFGITCFSIRLKNLSQYCSRASHWKRFIMLFHLISGAPINIPQIYLKEPIKEILLRVSHRCANELNENGIQVEF